MWTYFCLDKTGTITTNTLVLEHLHPFGIGEEQFRKLLALYISQTSSKNATSRAIETACPLQDNSKSELHVREEVAFSSLWKWSALSFEGTRLSWSLYAWCP